MTSAKTAGQETRGLFICLYIFILLNICNYLFIVMYYTYFFPSSQAQNQTYNYYILSNLFLKYQMIALPKIDKRYQI